MTAGSCKFKEVGVSERRARISRRTSLEKLSVVLKALGSNKTPIWHDDEEAREWFYTQSVDDIWLETIKKVVGRGIGFAPLASPFWQTYRTLGTEWLGRSLELY